MGIYRRIFSDRRVKFVSIGLISTVLLFAFIDMEFDWPQFLHQNLLDSSEDRQWGCHQVNELQGILTQISQGPPSYNATPSCGLTNDYETTFDGIKYKNDTPAPVFLVPNIVHYIRWNKAEYSFIDYICFRSAYINHRPSSFYIHTNVNFTGKWWDRIMAEPDWARRIEIFWSEPPSEVWGQELSKKWRFYHGSDVVRIRTLMKYGGIYFDNDVYVIQNLDQFRRYEMTLAWDEGQYLGTQIILANKNARFLVEWLETYKEYYPRRWYYNAGEKPTKEVLWKKPSLIHRIYLKFGVHMWLPEDLYNRYCPEWRSYYTVHLLMNLKYLHNKKFIEEHGDYDEKNILTFKMTFGEMVREMMPSDLLQLNA